MKEQEPINLTEGGPLPTLCVHCRNFLREKCVTQCQPAGDFSNFAPRPLREGESVPPCPQDIFNCQLGTREGQLLVGTYLAWIVSDLNKLRRGE